MESVELRRKQAGRALALMRKTEPGICAWPPCGQPFEGRPGKRFHTKKCKMAASRARRAVENATRQMTEVPVINRAAHCSKARTPEQCADEAARRLEKCLQEATEHIKRCGAAAIEDFRRCVAASSSSVTIRAPV